MTKGTRRPHPLCKLELTGRLRRLFGLLSHLEISDLSRTSAGACRRSGVLVLLPSLFRNANFAVRYILASVAFSLKSDFAGGGGEQGMVCAKANIATRVKFGSSLAYKNHAANNLLAAELLHAQTTASRIAAVARRTACLFVSHSLRSETCCGWPQGPANFNLSIAHSNAPVNLFAPRSRRFSRRRVAAGQNVGHPDDREVLLVAPLALRVLAAALLEGVNLRPARLLDGRAVEQRQYLVEHNPRARFAGQRHNRDRILGGDLVLLAAGLDDCEHRLPVFRPNTTHETCAAGFLAVDRKCGSREPRLGRSGFEPRGSKPKARLFGRAGARRPYRRRLDQSQSTCDRLAGDAPRGQLRRARKRWEGICSSTGCSQASTTWLSFRSPRSCRRRSF